MQLARTHRWSSVLLTFWKLSQETASLTSLSETCPQPLSHASVIITWPLFYISTQVV